MTRHRHTKQKSLAKKYDLTHVDYNCQGLVKYVQEGDHGFLRCLACNMTSKFGPLTVVTS
jgi:hypothetical protein